jgi:hypothetical protein
MKKIKNSRKIKHTSKLLPLFFIIRVWNPNFQYMPGIYHVYHDCMYMLSSPIYMEYTWYIHGYTTYILRWTRIYMQWYHHHDIHGYTTYIRVNQLEVYTWYIHVYTWYIRCISMHIPSFLLPDSGSDFSAGPGRGRAAGRVSFTGNAHMCASVGDQEWFITRTTMAIVLGEKPAHKRLISSLSPRAAPRRWRLAPRGADCSFRCGRLGGLVLVTMPQCCVVAVGVAAAVTSAVAAAVAAAVSGGGGCCDGGCAGFFPGGVAFNGFFHSSCQRWG